MPNLIHLGTNMSATVVIDNILPYTQAIATNLQTVFDTNWTADTAGDVIVYARGTGVAADDFAQVIDPVDYTVTFVGVEEFVRVTFGVGRTTADIVTIIRMTPAERMNLYTNTNFTPSMLNGDFGRMIMIAQQNETLRSLIGPHYNISDTIDLADVDGGQDIILPKLGANQIWAKNNANDEIIVYNVPASGGVAPSNATYILQTANSDLPNAQATGALATGALFNTVTSGILVSRVLTGTANQIDIANGDGSGGAPTFSITANPTIPGTESFIPPKGTTAQRPGAPVAGDTRYNTDLNALEVYEGSAWDPLSGGVVDSIIGTANQINVDNTDPANPVISLSATIDAPGTFTIQGTVVLDAIIDDDTMATATATNVPTAESVVAYVAATAGGAGGSNTEIQFNNAGALDGDSGFTTNGAGSVSIVGDLDVDNLRLDGNTLSSIAGDIILSAFADLDAGTNKIKNVVDPTLDQDAATKNYVDNAVKDIHFINPVKVATTANLAATYNNGASGVGATLTADVNGAASIDGVALALNDRAAFKDQTNAAHNGIYEVTQVGDGSSPAIYTRTTDFNTPAAIEPGDLVPVIEGTDNAGTMWIQTDDVAVIGTDDIVFIQWTADFSNVVTIDGTQTITGAKTFSSAITAETLQVASGNLVINNSGGGEVNLRISGANRLRVTNTSIIVNGVQLNMNGQSIASANVIVANGVITANGGINFGDQTLNKYQQNIAWTPSLVGSTVPGSPTGSFLGNFTRIGDTVTLSGQFILTSLGGLEGNVSIQGLPYPVRTGNGNRASITVGYRSGFSSTFVIGGWANASTSIIDLYNMEIDDTKLAHTAMTDTSNIIFSLVYRTAS